jgi:hypothetical protein
MGGGTWWVCDCSSNEWFCDGREYEETVERARGQKCEEKSAYDDKTSSKSKMGIERKGGDKPYIRK